MTKYRTTRRHFTDAQRSAIISLIPSFCRSVTVLWDTDEPGSTCTIRAHVSEFGRVQKAIRVVCA